MTHLRLSTALILLLAGCGNATFEGPPVTHLGGEADGAVPDPTQPKGDAPSPYRPTSVYAHSADKLYSINPDTLRVRLVGPFIWPAQKKDQMTDIAVDRSGRMIGISFDKVYRVDPKSAACTLLAPITLGFNGLSFISAGAGQPERLLGTTSHGYLHEIDPQTGKTKQVGSFSGLFSSGDLVSVKGFGTVATVKLFPSTTAPDYLARVDTTSNKLTLIGLTGFRNIWGLGYWKNKVFGFTESSQFVLIDVKSGKGKLVSSAGGPWWGAGVTTIAPTIE